MTFCSPTPSSTTVSITTAGTSATDRRAPNTISVGAPPKNAATTRPTPTTTSPHATTVAGPISTQPDASAATQSPIPIASRLKTIARQRTAGCGDRWFGLRSRRWESVVCALSVSVTAVSVSAVGRSTPPAPRDRVVPAAWRLSPVVRRPGPLLAADQQHAADHEGDRHDRAVAVADSVPADKHPDADDQADDPEDREPVEGRRGLRVLDVALGITIQADDVQQHADAAGEREHDERDADDRGVETEVVGDPGGDTADLAVRRADETPRCLPVPRFRSAFSMSAWSRGARGATIGGSPDRPRSVPGRIRGNPEVPGRRATGMIWR